MNEIYGVPTWSNPPGGATYKGVLLGYDWHPDRYRELVRGTIEMTYAPDGFTDDPVREREGEFKASLPAGFAEAFPKDYRALAIFPKSKLHTLITIDNHPHVKTVELWDPGKDSSDSPRPGYRSASGRGNSGGLELGNGWSYGGVSPDKINGVPLSTDYGSNDPVITGDMWFYGPNHEEIAGEISIRNYDVLHRARYGFPIEEGEYRIDAVFGAKKQP